MEFVELKSVNSLLVLKGMMIYELDPTGTLIKSTGKSIHEMSEDWFDSLSLDENELLIELLLTD